MRHFLEWMADQAPSDRPWLILGKGPSFARRGEFDLSAYRTLALNHVVRELPVDVAHAIDLDVAIDCAEAIEANAGVLVMPWVPHVANRPGERTLAELVGEVDIFGRMDRQGRLLWYDASSAKQPHGEFPIISVRFFSVEAAFNLLVAARVPEVFSLGVDGGSAYSQDFRDLNDTTRLANGRTVFDQQFEEIAKSVMASGVPFTPLGGEELIRVYVGSTEPQQLAVQVLEYSIRKHTSAPVMVFPLHHAAIPFATPKDVKNRPRTPFSFQRFTIPMLAGHQGKALYLDSDMQVFRDIRALWETPLNGADVLGARAAAPEERRPQLSVMLLDCSRLDWTPERIIGLLDSGELTYAQLMYELAVATDVRADIPASWNSLEHYDDSETALLHYTDMDTQPWLSPKNPLGHLWMRDLFEALDAGIITQKAIDAAIKKRHVRPSLGYQVKHRLADSHALPAEALALDDGWVPPHKVAHTPRTGLRAWVRRAYDGSFLQRVRRKIHDTLSI
jgi:hypothetical protein